MRPLILALATLTLATGCTKKLKTERVDERSKNQPAPAAPAPVDSPAPNSTPSPNATPSPAASTPSGPVTSTKPELPGVSVPTDPAVVPTDPAVVPTEPVTAPPVAPTPIPAGDYTLSRVLCPGGSEIPANTVVIKSADGVLSVTGDDELKARLLGGAPTLTYTVADGVLAVQSTDALPGYCNALKPVTLSFSSAPVTPTACVKRWSLDPETKNDEPKAFENELRWAANSLKKGKTRGLTNTVELKGDFTVRVSFKNFSPGGRGANFRLKLEDADDGKFFAFAMVGNNSAGAGLGPMLMAAITNDGIFDEANNATLGSRSQPDGVFTMTKVGKDLTVTAETVDGKIERKTSAAYRFSDGRYRLKLEAGNNSTLASLGNPTGIGFAKLEIKDGTGTELSGSDAFACDSLGN